MSKTKRREAIRARLTPEVVELWARINAGHDRYVGCLRGSPACDSPDPQKHCAVCTDYLNAHLALEAALGLKPWDDVLADDDLCAALDAALDEQEGA